MIRCSLILLLLAPIPGGAALRALEPAEAADSRSPSTRLQTIYESAAPAVVGIRCVLAKDLYFGSGSIIDPAGLVLTSITVAPAGAKDIQVFLRGGYSIDAELLKTVPELEFSLLRLRGPSDPEARRKIGAYPSIRLGDSIETRIGQLSFTLGNAFNSIDHDDQVSIASGIISGNYALTSLRAMSKYAGPVLETSAAVNDGMDGGPLLNSRGEIVGILSLNFSINRWMGTAVPIHRIKPLLSEYQARYSDRDQQQEGFIGIELTELGKRGGAEGDGASSVLIRSPLESVWISHVYAGSPAAQAGLQDGFRLLAINGEAVAGLETAARILQRLKPGSRARLRVAPIGEASKVPEGQTELDIQVWGRF